jgi:hypothetical protein
MAKQTKKTINAITAEELAQLQELQSGINNAAMNLANIEIAKYELLQDHATMKKAMQELSMQLQASYGEVNISLVDGTISEIEKPELKAE